MDLSPDSSHCTHSNQHSSNDQMANFIQIDISSFLHFSDGIDAVELLELAMKFGNNFAIEHFLSFSDVLHDLC